MHRNIRSKIIIVPAKQEKSPPVCNYRDEVNSGEGLALVEHIKKKKESGHWKGSGLITLAGKEIEYRLRFSKKSKGIRLKIDLESGLEVVLPEGFSISKLEPLIKGKENWILSKLRHFELIRQKIKPNDFDKSNAVLYLGREYSHIKVIRKDIAPEVKMIDDRLFITVPDDSRQTLVQALEGWYRLEAAKVIKERAVDVGRQLNLQFNRITVRNQKTRWGSCSRLKNLNFNWRLIMAPVQVIDYLIIHEVAHLAEMNHSSRFWKLVEEFCPDYKLRRKWLKENGPMLTI